MPSKRVKYTIASIASIAAMTLIASVVSIRCGRGETTVPLVILGSFFCAANAGSMFVRDLFQNTKSNSITSFYLIDKAVRFLASLMLITTLIYIYKENALIIGISSFLFYIMAMVLEVAYFFDLERKKRIQNV
jgi:hypothetical protein